MELRKFRKQHNELKSVVSRVLPPGSYEMDAIKEINAAYDEIKDKEVLLLSKGNRRFTKLTTPTEGTELWESALKKYDDRIDRVEAQITATLRDRLATAKNANEMFRVFSKFNALFVRPRVTSIETTLMLADQRSDSRVPSTTHSTSETRHLVQPTNN